MRSGAHGTARCPIIRCKGGSFTEGISAQIKKHGGSPGRQGGIAGERAVDEAHFINSEQAEAEALTGRRCLSCIFFGIRASNVGGGAYP